MLIIFGTFFIKTIKFKFFSFLMSSEPHFEDYDGIMNEKIEFVESIYKCTKESIEKAKSLILRFPQNFVINILLSASKIKIFDFMLIGDLFALLPTPIQIDSQIHYMHFECYLYQKGILKNTPELAFYSEDLHPIEEYEHPFKENTLWSFIQKDDINNFVKNIMNNNTQFNEEVIRINTIPFNIIEFACFCDSINIVKYLILNENFSPKSACDFAVRGGSEKVIEYIASRDVSFDGLMSRAIQYHQNSVAKWLNNNYNDSSFNLPKCLWFYNYEMFLYFVNECGFDINQPGLYRQTSLAFAKSQNDIGLVKFLISKGAIE